MWAASCNEVVRSREESVQKKKLTLGHGHEANLQLVAKAMMPDRHLQLCSRSYYDHCRWRPLPGDPSTWEVGCNTTVVHCTRMWVEVGWYGTNRRPPEVQSVE